MRLRRFDLLRYGHFTDRSIDFGQLADGGTDLHLIIGPNEAGKSTMLSGLGDLLFGIGGTSAYNFLHDYQAMRLGGVVENPSGELAFLRRKGNQKTLLDMAEQPLADDALAPFTGGADRAWFERMFGLDHVRLREGGQAILEAKDDVGKMLFEASSGIANLGEELQRLDEDAAAIFRPRGSTQFLALAVAKHQAAAAAAKAAVYSTKDWMALVDSLAEIGAQKQQLNNERRALDAEAARLQRIRRAKPRFLKLDQVAEELAALGERPFLRVDFEAQVRAASEALSAAQGSERTARDSLKQLQERRAAITVDTAVLAQAARKEALVTLQVRASTANLDIPRRESEYNELIGAAKAEMARIGLPGEPIGFDQTRLPTIQAISQVRNMISGYRDIKTRSEAAHAQRDDAQKALQRADERIAGMGPPADLADPLALRRLIAKQEQHRGVEAACADKRRRLANLEDDLRDNLPALHLDRLQAEELANRVFPTGEQVTAASNELAAFERRREAGQRQIEDLETELAALRKVLARIEADSGLPMPDDLAGARAARDESWRAIKDGALAGRAPTAQAMDSMDGHMGRADDTADRMIGDAARYEEISGHGRGISTGTDKMVEYQRQVDGILGQIEDWRRRWQDLWLASGLDAPELGRAPAVLQHRDRALEIVAEIRRERRELDAMETTIQDCRQEMIAALAGFEGRDRSQLSLSELLIDGAEMLSELSARHNDLQNLVSQQDACAASLRDIDAAVAEWTKREAAAMAAWSQLSQGMAILDGEMDIEQAEAVFEPIEILRGKLAEIDGLGHRIKTMGDDILAFNKLAGELSETFALGDLTGLPLEVAGAIVATYDAAVADQTQANLMDQQIEKADEDCRRAGLAVQTHGETIAALCRTAGVETVGEVAAVVARCAKADALGQEQDQITDGLANDGDGIELTELRRQCDAIDPDQIPGRLHEIEQERPGLEQRLEEVIRRERDLQQQENEIRAAQGAADPEQDAAQKLATVVEEAERYLRLKTSARLLRWAIEQHRKEMQGPLLSRASALFNLLTVERYKRLFADFGEGDHARLMGENRNGNSILIEQMSDGTRDQLYLSLRLAAVAHYGETSTATLLPFVADDLLVNFDDARAAAGFQALRELSRNVQVIVFTHHQHLADVARGALGENGWTVHRL